MLWVSIKLTEIHAGSVVNPAQLINRFFLAFIYATSWARLDFWFVIVICGFQMGLVRSKM